MRIIKEADLTTLNFSDCSYDYNDYPGCNCDFKDRTCECDYDRCPCDCDDSNDD